MIRESLAPNLVFLTLHKDIRPQQVEFGDRCCEHGGCLGTFPFKIFEPPFEADVLAAEYHYRRHDLLFN